ncbi:deoxyuridine 5'-triphosphate nucleotidohydrolase [Bacillus sp. HMSC76G11]|nr:deoxyuridine 5'-triphosphate nucleotidohydrolase [Bacillus sp. HMSC76G11]
MNVKIKRLSDDAVIPKYAKAGDSGFDLVATENVFIEPGQSKKVPVGLAFEIEQGYELQIRPRSGITSKTKLRVQLGTVDSGYRGEVSVSVDNISHLNTGDLTKNIKGKLVDEYGLIDSDYGGCYIIKKGDRIAQGVIAPVIQATFEEAEELSESERGAGGFGSTGVTV